MTRFLKITLKILLVLFIVFVGFFFWGSSSVHPLKEKSIIINTETKNSSANDSIFSIATYNIGYLSGMTNNLPVAKPKSLFDNNLLKVKSVLAPLNIDILAFQEIDFESARSYDVNQQLEIAKLGYPFIGQTVNWDKRYVAFPYWPLSMHFGRIYSGQSVLSQYPITSQERIILDAVADAPFYRTAFYLDRLAQVDKININGKTVVVINVHLEAFDKPTRDIQTKKMLAIYNRYKDSYPTLLVGDFNSDIKFTDASIAPIINSPDIGIAAYKIPYPNTFNSINPSKRIDYILYNKNFIEEINSRVLTEMGDASDHLPLMMTFKLK
ncbi:MAG: endonuclease/exonuclease/phosphatase family protein [Flavobacteriales bacterium]|jgi:endonuclease/exonuclease/phosphatase family metal-dependent hydrolase|nr:endonuclease/exonuclease/phosphatase family protein [Flavobacteriales bacterium]